jgi:hypothetical protein
VTLRLSDSNRVEMDEVGVRGAVSLIPNPVQAIAFSPRKR